MKHLYQHILRCLLAVGALGLLMPSLATAQRTDSLMTKVDVIAPNAGTTTLNGFIYYLADDGTTGYELWRTDGTKAGTKLVKDIRPGKASAFVSDSSFYYFGRDNSSTSYSFSAQRVKDALRAFRPYVHLTANLLYFWADNGTNGIELWKSDGTETGTQMVTDLIPGSFSTGTQYDILTGGNLGGTNGGYTNGYYYGWSFTPRANKLLFWTSNVSNTLWETDGTAAGTRDINFQPTKYRNTTGSAQVVNGRTFINTSLYDKGKYYYSVLQDNGTATATPINTNSPDNSINVLLADKRGVVYSVQKSDTKQTSYSIFRRDSTTAKTAMLKQITTPKPATGTNYQYMYSLGQTASEVWLRAYDTPTTTGKGSDELWRIDLATDSVQRVKRYDYNQVTVGSETRLEKGSEAYYYYQAAPAGIVFLARTADTTSTYAGNRFTAQVYDAKSGKLQVLQDSLLYGFGWYNYAPSGQGGKTLFLSRPTPKDPVRLWLTDGRTKQIIKTLGQYEFTPSFAPTDAGPVTVAYVYNRDKANKILNYKVDVWKLDSTSAGTTRVGQANNFPSGVGSVFASGGGIYSNFGAILKLSTPAPDSIHYLADIANYSNAFALDGNSLGIFNGRIMSEVNGTMLAVDPKAAPRKCLINYYSQTRASTYYNTKDLGYCPAKDSVVTLRQQASNYNAGTGEISRIYYKNLTWLRDSTVLQSGNVDSLKLRQQGQYALSLKGVADGCTATDTWQVYYSTPTVAQIPKLVNDRKVLAGVIAGGYPINGGNGYYSGKWERTTTDGAVSQATTETSFNAASGYRNVTTAALDESVGNAYQPKYGTYTLKITDANSCSATGTFVYDDKTTILGIAVALSARNGADLCAGTPVSYTATASGGKAPYTFRWLRSGAPVSGVLGGTGSIPIDSDILTTDFSGSFSMEATDADGKKTYSNETTYFVHAAPAITLTASSLTVSTGKSATLTANATNYQYPTFGWAKDNAVVSGAASRTLTATQAGLYSVTVGSGDKFACVANASLRIGAGSGRVAASAGQQTFQVISVVSGLSTEGKAEAVMQIIPNPSEGPTRVRLQLPEPAAVKGQVVDTQGRVIHRWEEPMSMPVVDMTIDLSPQPVGMYMIQVEVDGAVLSKKVIKK